MMPSSSRTGDRRQLSVWSPLAVFCGAFFSVGIFCYLFLEQRGAKSGYSYSLVRGHETALAEEADKLHPLYRDTSQDLQISPKLEGVDTLYVIPGGGSGDRSIVIDTKGGQFGYPEWTQRRVTDAYAHYKKHGHEDSSAFLALSAGSLNSPNRMLPDGRILFECQHTMSHLRRLKVPEWAIIGDFVSWDTVTNGLFLRMTVEGLLTASTVEKETDKKPSKLQLHVFISDFHAARVKASFDWVLGLSPSLLPNVTMTIHSVSSMGIKWPDQASFAARIAHEEKGVQVITENSKKIRTISEFYAFLFFGKSTVFIPSWVLFIHLLCQSTSLPQAATKAYRTTCSRRM